MNLYEIGILDRNYGYAKSIKIVSKDRNGAIRKFLEKFQELTGCCDSTVEELLIEYLRGNFGLIYFANFGKINKGRNLAKTIKRR